MPRVRRLTKRSIFTVVALAVATAAGTATIVATATPSNAATCNGYVALTFDDGPNASNTTNLLNTLKSAGVRATLFNIGQNAQNNQALVKAEQSAGMWIGNHSWSHPHMTSLSAASMSSELSQTQQTIQQATGTTPKIFRPPYGETNATLKSAATALGLTQVTWDVDSQDWNGASTAAAIVQAAAVPPDRRNHADARPVPDHHRGDPADRRQPHQSWPVRRNDLTVNRTSCCPGWRDPVLTQHLSTIFLDTQQLIPAASVQRHLPGHHHDQRVEHRAHRQYHHHEHQHRGGQRLAADIHPGQWSDHHFRVERDVQPDQWSGDRHQCHIQRGHRTQCLGRHRLPGQPQWQQCRPHRVRTQRNHLRDRLTAHQRDTTSS